MAVQRDDTPIQYLRGVGPQRAAEFERLGVRRLADLIEYFPFRYEQDLGEIDIADLTPDVIATVRGEVTRTRGRWPNFAARLSDGTGTCTLRWFHLPQRATGHGVDRGAMLIATGRTREFDGGIELVQPTIRRLDPDAPVAPAKGGARLLGVYRGSEALPPPLVGRIVRSAVEAHGFDEDDPLPAALRAQHGLMERGEAVRTMHLPDNLEVQAEARRRLAYEELLLLQIALAHRRASAARGAAGRLIRVSELVDARIRRRFPFALTSGQDAVLRDIVRDLGSGRPMSRLIQGDVGCGKTVVALYACLATIAAGGQAAILAPTELLAQQHFTNVEHYLHGSRVQRTFLRGKLPAAERRAALASIAGGDATLVVGTHALLERDVSFPNLALVVVDESHKFGVLQRVTLRTKGAAPHYLVMTATPIPRTLAMTVFGDLDVSLLKGRPPGRGRVRTRTAPRSQSAREYASLRARLERGEQAYVVCPLVGEAPEAAESDGTERAWLRTAIETHRSLSQGAWRGLQIGLLHGAMPPAEKQRVLDQFREGKLHAVVATTVVEVGVDVPSATLMIVEHAERFGLSQLHQLRGRIGRGGRDGECILIAPDGPVRRAARGPEAVPDDAALTAKRLATLCATEDGFRIAEADLRLRGPGDVLGTRQHGLPELRVADLTADLELLEAAQRDAQELVRRDPQLRAHSPLRAALVRVYGERIRLVDAG